MVANRRVSHGARIAVGERHSAREIGVIFNAFERMVAFRYLRARRQEGFVSVIAIFSLLGIALGVATLIIVMSVMNGFRADLLGRILGLNGDLGGLCHERRARRFRCGGAKGPRQSRASSGSPRWSRARSWRPREAGAAGALVRGIRPDDMRALPLLADHIVAGLARRFRR